MSIWIVDERPSGTGFPTPRGLAASIGLSCALVCRCLMERPQAGTIKLFAEGRIAGPAETWVFGLPPQG